MRAATLCCALLAASLQAQAPPAQRVWPIDQAPPQLSSAVSHANLLVLTMQDALLRELGSALAQGGPEGAVNSCHVDIEGVIQRLGREPGVEAGRTSDRLRNPRNRPRPWTAPLVEANAGRQARDVEGFVVDLGERVGVLKSIASRPLCASCHGPEKELTPGVRAALATRYPADRAVGFHDGEIRGWFWVEMPKRSR